MDIRQFEYVNTIAQERSLSRAAEKLHISAPSLSQFLTRLEGELGIRLFFRDRIGALPTEAGKVYLEGAQAILRTYGDTLDRLTRLREAPGRVVRVGVTPGRSEALFTDFLPTYMATHPEAEVRMEEAPMAQLDESLRAGDIDFALAVLRFSDPSLSGEILYSKELVLALSVEHPARELLPPPERGPLTPENLAALAGEKFIVSKPGYRFRDAADFYLGAAGFAPQQLMETTQIEQVCRLIRRGVGIGFISRDLAANQRDLVAFALTPALRLEFGVQFLRGHEPSGYGREFVQELHAYLHAVRPRDAALFDVSPAS